MSADYRQRETLVELYHDEGLSQREVADRLDCGQSTVRKWMDRLDVSARPRIPQLSDPIPLGQDADGYEVWQHQHNGTKWTCLVHRLCAVAWFGKAGEAVHHRNGIPWDNRKENLQNMTQQQHNKHHAKEGAEARWSE